MPTPIADSLNEMGLAEQALPPSPPPATGTKNRILQLDILRGVAILLVLNVHRILHPESTGVLSPLAIAGNRIGWSGVDLFFVLSGFLIGGLLFQEVRSRGSLDMGRFFIRRGFKIWPTYLLYLAFLLVLLGWTKGDVRSVAWEMLLSLPLGRAAIAYVMAEEALQKPLLKLREESSAEPAGKQTCIPRSPPS